ncbi:alpha-N-arabinofuranosidase [Actinomycetota bacterium]|nr:alpha-N-arabinofuranosidase [Actinomycetota bacterium]
MSRTTIALDPAAVLAPVRRELFGSFVEHLGRAVYTGLYEPGHPTADDDGFRQDVLDLVRELGVSTVRYPGGNFVSGYRWEDAIGPRESRPARLDLAWHSTEPNLVGVDEFMTWARKAGVEPMMAVNLGTRGVQEALDLLEYCNHAGGTAWSDRRRANGAAQPYDVRMWCLGNEMDGPWQIGHKTAREYGRLAAETARAMRMVDPGLTLVACGSSGADMDTFGAWEATVLDEAYDEVDLISAHSYFWERDGDLASFLASGVTLDRFLDEIVATADHVRARRKASKRINISVDEWNVWYLEDEPSKPPTGADWPVAPPLLEDHYSVADAVVVGALLISLLRHSDRVVSASLAQLVNVIAPIMTEPGGGAWRQTTFHPFAQASAAASGVVLVPQIRSDDVETLAHGPVAQVDAVATWDADAGRAAVFLVNRSTTDPAPVTLDVRAFPGAAVTSATTLTDADPHRVPDRSESEAFGPRAMDSVLQGGQLDVVLPPASWSVVQLRTTR